MLATSAQLARLLVRMDRLSQSAQFNGLASLQRLRDEVPEIEVAREARAWGLAPEALSPWFATRGSRQSGLLLGIATADEVKLSIACDRLHQLIERFRERAIAGGRQQRCPEARQGEAFPLGRKRTLGNLCWRIALRSQLLDRRQSRVDDLEKM